MTSATLRMEALSPSGVAMSESPDIVVKTPLAGAPSESGCDAMDDQMPEPKPHFVMRWLTTLTVLGCLLGIAAGICCQIFNASEDIVKILGFPGQLFIRSLKVMVVPMIFCSMVVSTSAVGVQGGSNRIASMAIKFYLSTTFVAAVEGIALFNLFRFMFTPVSEQTQNSDSAASTTAAPVGKLSILDTILKFGYDLVPDNLADAFLQTQLLGVISFAIFFGYVVSGLPNGKLVVTFFDTCCETLVGMIRVIIFATPLGVGSLVAGSVAKAEDFASVVENLGVLIIVVLIGQLFHVFGFYSGLYLWFTKRNPLKHLLGMSRACITAFGTSSSAATLSTTIKCCEDLGISKEAVQFVLPIGCTVNMDGSALERPIVVLWIAYVAGQPIPLEEQLVVALTSALLSIGGSPIPSAGVSTLIVMLESAQVQLTPSVMQLAAFAMAIEWLLDSIRTTVNVTGDSVGVAVIDHMLRASHEEPVIFEKTDKVLRTTNRERASSSSSTDKV